MSSRRAACLHRARLRSGRAPPRPAIHFLALRKCIHSTRAALRRRPVIHRGGRSADGPYATVTAACRNAPLDRRGCRCYRALPRLTVTCGLLRTSRRRARDNRVDSTVGYVGSTAAWQHFAGLRALTTRGCARARGFVHGNRHFSIVYESYVLTGRCSGLLRGR